MDKFDKKEFTELASIAQDPCISLYLPMQVKGKETRQNAIRFKNALSQVKALLAKLQRPESDFEAILEPMETLLDNGAFWRNQNQGLAIFSASNLNRIYRLPLPFEDLQSVGRRFHLKPLIPLLTDNVTFHVLAFAKKGVTLYRCDRFSIAPVEVENLPQDITEALRHEWEQGQVQFYTGQPIVQGGNYRAAAFFGGASISEQNKDQILRFGRKVNTAVFEALRNETGPLVLAGVDYLLPIYKEVNTVANLKEEVIVGHPDRLNPETLQQKGWEIVAAELQDQQQKVIARYNDLKGTGYTVKDLPALIRSAYEGRVAQLVLGAEQHCWGMLDEADREVIVRPDGTPAPGEVDLLDVAACLTVLKSGDVMTVPPEKLPDAAQAIAILRY